MPIPRFRDADGEYEIILLCRTCGWCIPKDRMTHKWKQCQNCGYKLETARADYRGNPYNPTGIDRI